MQWAHGQQEVHRNWIAGRGKIQNADAWNGRTAQMEIVNFVQRTENYELFRGLSVDAGKWILPRVWPTLKSSPPFRDGNFSNAKPYKNFNQVNNRPKTLRLSSGGIVT